jgi:hypothetical protein
MVSAIGALTAKDAAEVSSLVSSLLPSETAQIHAKVMDMKSKVGHCFPPAHAVLLSVTV